MRPSLLLLAVALLAAPLAAGLWDRDRPEPQDLPSAFDVISGRYDQLPDMVYEQRLQRVNARIAGLPLDEELTSEQRNAVIEGLPLYDDAAVAQYRLGDLGAAILTLDRKSLQIERIQEQHVSSAREHELRYLANKSTCLLARWKLQGNRGDLELARKLLERSLEIDRHNWDAGWTLTEVEWYLSNPEYTRSDPIFPNLLGLVDADFRTDFEPAALSRKGIEGCIEHLSRRIVYEGALEDVDVLHALSLGLTLAGQRQEAIFAWFRVGELIEGEVASRVKHDLKPAALERILGVHLGELQEAADQRKIYQKLRQDSDAYVKSRNTYLERRMEAGDHPDTNPAFWAAWALGDKGPPSPTQPPDPTPEPIMSRTVILGGVGALIGIFLLLFLAMMLLGRNKSPHPTVDEL